MCIHIEIRIHLENVGLTRILQQGPRTGLQFSPRTPEWPDPGLPNYPPRVSLQKVGIWIRDVLCRFPFFSRFWVWRIVKLQLSGFYCKRIRGKYRLIKGGILRGGVAQRAVTWGTQNPKDLGPSQGTVSVSCPL